MKRLLTILLLFTIAVSAAKAHSTGENYIFINVYNDRIDGRVELHFNELKSVLGLQPETGAAAAGWVNENRAVVLDYIRDHFKVSASGAEMPVEYAATGVMDLPQGLYAQYHFRIPGPIPDELDVSNTIFFEDNPRHRGLLLVDYNQKTGKSYGEEHTALVFSPGNSDQNIDLLNVPSILDSNDFVWQGILHIWIGIDHILFLMALIFPAVMMRVEGRWVPVPTFRQAFWKILKIVTLFTIAHSITLSLAALNFIVLPSALVESIIALSIVVVALNNMFPRFNAKSWMLILFFGLFHGLGFASVMGHLPFRMVDLIKVVLGFNIGVEIGQVAIVLAAFPILFFLRSTRIYIPLILHGSSVVVGVIAAYWFVQRAFGLE